MAYLAQLGALTDQLIVAVSAASPHPDPTKPSPRRDFVIRTLRNHNRARINQFEVDDQLHGLVERLRITGREALGDALAKRLGALDPLRTTWTPEILFLFLELSDRPSEKSSLRRLDSLRGPEERTGPRLTWRDIAKEDGWNEDGDLWRNVSFAEDSDDDAYEEEEEEEGSETSSESDESSISSPQCLERLVVQGDERGDEDLVRRIAECQAWRSSDRRTKKTPVSELQVLREVLFMLGGLNTTLFDEGHNPVLSYQLLDISWDTHKALMTSFAEHGRTLAPLRRFAASKQQIPLLQVFHRSIQESLGNFDNTLAHLQRRFVVLKTDVIVSLMQVSAELKADLASLYELSRIVQRVQEERDGNMPAYAFHYLELLFDAASLAQMAGNDAAHQMLGTMFFDCFKVYLRNMRTWMEDGELLDGDGTFFVSQSPSRSPLHQIWGHRFKLKEQEAPSFLQPAMIQRIFATGKSMVVLKELGRYEWAKAQWKAEEEAEPALDFATICARDVAFAPFADVFHNALDRWIESKHHTASAKLRELLLCSCGLSASLDALQCIYLMADASRAAETFSSALFRQLDGLGSGWRDRFVLSEMCQEAYTSVPIETFRLSARLEPPSLVPSAVASRSSVRLSLPAVRLHYRLDWPVRIVVPEDAVRGYQTVFTFLLQIRRAMSTLHRRHFSVAGGSGSGFGSGSGSGSHAHALRKPDGAYHLLRTKLLWFCNNLMSYLGTLVIGPNVTTLRETLRCAVDVDDMIKAHAAFMDRLREESCLGTRLQPIRECMLDLLDLAIKLEDAHDAERIRRADEDQEPPRLSAASWPYKAVRDQGDDEDDDEDEYDMDPDAVGILRKSVGAGMGPGKSYAQMLGDMHVHFERHVRFVAGGLRGVARASRHEAGAKWDLLAEMLEVGMKTRDGR